MQANILKSVCEYFSFGYMPFLQRSKIPFEYEGFKKDLAIISSVFYSRQLLVVSGGSGLGKTSLLSYAVNELDPSSFRVCHIELSNPNKKAIYKTLAVKMGLSPAFNGDDIKLQLHNFFNEENEQGKFNCVILDESHSLSIPMVDELRSFYDEGANFSLILAGLPPLLSRTMNLSVNQPMKQRINLVVELSPLTLSESKNYIRHQLELSRVKNEVFDEKCYPFIHSVSSGTPRKINQLCYQMLVDSYFAKKIIITEDDIRDWVKRTPHLFETNAQNN